MTESSSAPHEAPAPTTTEAAPMPGADAASRHEPRSYIPTLAGAKFGLAVALMTPMMVSLAFKLQHITATQEDATSALGLVLGVGALFALVANPLAGRLSDRTTSRLGRRRPWIIGGALVGFLSLALIGVATSVPVVLVGWCLVQASINAALSATQATLSDQVPHERRGRVTGIVGIMAPLGVLGGTFLVNAFSSDFARLVAPAALGTVLALLFGFTLKDHRLPSKPSERFGPKNFFGSFVFNPRAHPDFGWAWLTKFFVMFGYAGIATFLPFYLTEKFGLAEQDAVATILASNAISTAFLVMTSPLSGILSDRIGKRRPFVAAAGIIMVVGLTLLAFAPNIGIVLVSQAIIGLGAGAFFSVDLALATEVLPNAATAAKDLGVFNIANTLPQSIAPAIAPTIIAIGATTALGGYATWYLFGAVVALAGAILVYRIKGVK